MFVMSNWLKCIPKISLSNDNTSQRTAHYGNVNFLLENNGIHHAVCETIHAQRANDWPFLNLPLAESFQILPETTVHVF